MTGQHHGKGRWIFLEDERIIGLFFERSQDAVAQLSKKYGRLLLKVAVGILNNVSDSEECVNDAYLAAWDSIPPNRPKPLSSYLCRIVRNLCVKRYHFNTAAKRNSVYDAALDELEGCFPAGGTAEDDFDAAEAARALNRFLGTLERENRVIFVRRYWLCESLDDIAALFGTTAHNISARLYRTRERLKKYLKKEGVQL